MSLSAIIGGIVYRNTAAMFEFCDKHLVVYGKNGRSP